MTPLRRLLHCATASFSVAGRRKRWGKPEDEPGGLFLEPDGKGFRWGFILSEPFFIGLFGNGEWERTPLVQAKARRGRTAQKAKISK